MPVAFADFLQAKFALDERSLNREVRAAFLDELRRLPQVRCLDVGAGTCATLRRLLHGGLAAPLFLTALDQDPELLAIARREIPGWLRARGLEARTEDGVMQVRGERRIDIRFAAVRSEEHRPDSPYDVVTAHAFMDIAPLADTLRRFASWLRPGGILYASINYDGDTTLLPVYGDAEFEGRLLAHYDATMEQRRVDGQATGGALCGRRLHALLPQHGFDVLACGSSDWNITPLRGEYRDSDAVCLQALLELIRSEAERARHFHPDALERWHEDRSRALRQRRLGAIVHQLDLLARYRP